MKKILIGLMIFSVVFIMSCSVIEFPGDATGDFKRGYNLGTSASRMTSTRCSDGDVRCSGNDLMRCAKGRYKTVETCVAGCEQSSKAGRTLAKCKELRCENPVETGRTRCNGDQILKERNCADGRSSWVLDQTCAEGCASANGRARCNVGEPLGYGYLIFDGVNPVTEDLKLYFETDREEQDVDFDYLGHSASDSNIDGDLLYERYDISIFDEDARTGDGVIVLDPVAHAPSDTFEIRVPSEISDFEARINLISQRVRDVVTKTFLIGDRFFDINQGFGSTIDADDLDGMFDGSVIIGGQGYDYRDEIRFRGPGVNALIPLTLETGLTFDQDMDWRDRVFVPMEINSWGYYIVFEDQLPRGSRLNDGDPVTLNFLGREFSFMRASSDAVDIDFGDFVARVRTGDPFVGEDEFDPAWRWHLENLDTENPTIGIRWALPLDDPEEFDNPLYEHPLYEGERICLPFLYVCMEFEGLIVDDYQYYEVETGVIVDLYESEVSNNPSVVSAKVLEVHSKGIADRGFIAGGERTDTVALYPNPENPCSLGIYREVQDGSKNVLVKYVRGPDHAFDIEYRDSILPVNINWNCNQ